MHSEGYVQITNEGSPEYHYAITDHLGNTRLVYYDKNLNGKIESASQIVQENHYYPFGLKMKGAWTGDENIATTANNLRTRTTAAMVRDGVVFSMDIPNQNVSSHYPRSYPIYLQKNDLEVFTLFQKAMWENRGSAAEEPKYNFGNLAYCINEEMVLNLKGNWPKNICLYWKGFFYQALNESNSIGANEKLNSQRVVNILGL